MEGGRDGVETREGGERKRENLCSTSSHLDFYTITFLGISNGKQVFQLPMRTRRIRYHILNLIVTH